MADERSHSSLTRAGSAAWSLLGLVGLVLFAGWAAAVMAAVAVLVALVWLIVPPFLARVAALGASVVDGAHQVAYSVGAQLGHLDHAAVDGMLDEAAARLRSRLGAFAGDAVAGASTVVGVAASAVLVFFLSFFLVRDGARMWEWIVELTPERRRPAMRAMGMRSWQVLTVYTRGVVFVATVDAVLIGAGLLIVGVPLALPLIVLTWLAAFFPIIGAVTAGAAAVLVALVSEGMTAALIMLAVIVIVQQLEGNVLYPAVVGPRLRLHPVAVLIAVAVGGTIGGIPGAFLAVPCATVASAVLGYAREAAEAPARRRLFVRSGRA